MNSVRRTTDNCFSVLYEINSLRSSGFLLILLMRMETTPAETRYLLATSFWASPSTMTWWATSSFSSKENLFEVLLLRLRPMATSSTSTGLFSRFFHPFKG